ncbi:uncharacterized protein LOC123016465 [Tribolium madens]|uniref:uncharacterized protein LOC123016465 n=1 Tax=Tribolium madens TaxID=41895 RepID=UPI001CF76015|nr:uncharacterized protein LOC123016465 [Tribolium madens]
MGQSNATLRLKSIKTNVSEITKKIRNDDLSTQEIDRSHEILLDYVKELKYILSKNMRVSKIRKVEKAIIAALQDLATLEGTLKTIEPRLKAKSMQTLADIEKNIKTIGDNLVNQNFELDKKVISNYKKRMSFIDDVDDEIGVRKTELLDVMSCVENVLSEKEIEEELKQAEEKHYLTRHDLSDKNFLTQLKNEVEEITEVSEKVKKRKEYLLYNIDNSILALQNKDKQDSSATNSQLVTDVVESYNNFEDLFSPNCNLDELESVFDQLSAMRMRLDQRLKVLENQIKIEKDVDKIPVKESEVHGPTVIEKLNKIKETIENIQTQISRLSYSENSHIYKNFHKVLKKYKTEVNELSNDENLILSTSVSKLIDDVLVILDKNVSTRNSTSGDVFVDIMSIGASVDKLRAQIQISSNTREDHDLIRNDLLGHLQYLKKLEIPPARTNVCQFRDYLIIQIDSYLSYLAKK